MPARGYSTARQRLLGKDRGGSTCGARAAAAGSSWRARVDPNKGDAPAAEYFKESSIGRLVKGSALSRRSQPPCGARQNYALIGKMRPGRLQDCEHNLEHPVVVDHVAIRESGFDRGCAKTLQAHFVRCIVSHVRSISYDFVCSNRSLSILRGARFEFLHSLDRQRTVGGTSEPANARYALRSGSSLTGSNTNP